MKTHDWAVIHVRQSPTEAGMRRCDSGSHAVAVRDGLPDHYLPARAVECRDGTLVAAGPVRRGPTVREELLVAVEHLRDDHQAGDVDRDGVLDRLHDWRPDLSAPERWELWEHIDTALTRLEEVRSPMFCLSGDDQLQLEQEWVASLDEGIDRLMGVRR